ncbi:MAG: glucosyltransferase domain-containing protein [Wohlfahrtiimonas sp.]
MISDTFQKQKYLYLVFFLFFAQFFILDAYYFDDLFRAQDGAFGWRRDGRALGGFFYKILLNFQSPLADIYPVPLIVSGLFFCFIVYHLCKSLNIICTKQQALILLLLISNPLALSNWLFRYDSAFMLLSVAFALLPFCILHISTKKWFIYSALSLLGTLMSYQISINIFIGFSAIFAFKLSTEHKSPKDIIKFILLSIVTLSVAYLIYSKIILTIIPTHDYFAQFRELPTINNFLYVIHHNIVQSYEIIYPLFPSGLFTPFIIGLLFSIYSVVKTKNTTIVLFYFTALLITTFSISGVMLFSPNAPFSTRIFLGIIPLLIFPIITLALFKNNKLFFISSAYLCLTMIVIDRATLNATSAEIKHQNIISQQIMTEASINHITEIEQIMILRRPIKSGIAQISEKTYPIVSAILPHTFLGSYDGGRYIMMFNGYPKTTYPKPKQQEQLTQKIKSEMPIASNPLYKLYYIDQVLIINFEN